MAGGTRRTRAFARISELIHMYWRARAAIVAAALSDRFPRKPNIDTARVLADGKPSNFPASRFSDATQIQEQPVEDDATTRSVLATTITHRSRLPSRDTPSRLASTRNSETFE